jgi:hypothetical protein
MSNSRGVWKKLLSNFKPYSGYEVDKYYGISLLKLKSGGMYNIKLIYDYDSHGKFSNAYAVEDLQKALKIIEILEWFADDDHLRAASDDDIDIDETDDEIPGF